jgi:hypothetical protein
VSLAWDHHEEASLDVLEYESSRPPRRNYWEIQTPAATRIELLEKNGYSPQDIDRAQSETDREKRLRSTSPAIQELEPLQIAMESLARKWRRWRKGKSSKEEQDELWKNANKGKTIEKSLEKKAPPPEAPSTATTSPESSISTLDEDEEMA